MVSGSIAAFRKLPGRIFPGLNERRFARERDAWCLTHAADPDYQALMPSRDGAESVLVFDRPTRIVVIPMEGPDVDVWRHAGGSHFHEIWQSAREIYGPDRVDLFGVDPRESIAQWHGRLVSHLVSSGATHVVFQVEHDPNRPDSYSWDLLVMNLVARWDGILLGVVYDSAFEWITAPARRLARSTDRFVLVDICQPMDGALVRGRPEVGPVTMAISDATLDAIDAYGIGRDKDIDVSFVGALYPDRVDFIERVRAAGVNIKVNPHRNDTTTNYLESRTNQPSYLDYLAGLRRSWLTINLSRSSSGNGQQLKTRILEACSVGTVVVTDDVGLTERFWTPYEDYVPFSSPEELPSLLPLLLSDKDRLLNMANRAQEKARRINGRGFWDGIDAGLRVRGLKPLVPKDSPPLSH